MNTILEKVKVSPVNMEERKKLGIRPGDTVKVHQKIQDKGKTRIQIFDGVVLARKHGDEPGATFTVRKITSGVGVEKVYPLYSPLIDKIEIVKRAKVRRAKLYYIREKVAREIKRQMRRMKLVALETESEIEAESRKAKEAEEAAAKAEEEAKNKEAEVAKAEETTDSAEEVKEEVVEETEEKEVATEEAPVEETKEEEKTEETPVSEESEESNQEEGKKEAETEEEKKQ